MISYVIDGTYTLLASIDDTWKTEVDIYNLQGGQYRKMVDTIHGEKLCTLGYNETFRDYFENFQAHQDHPVAWKTCPYPAGSKK